MNIDDDFALEPIQFDLSKGWPVGKNLIYKCLRCGNLVASFPSEQNLMLNWECGCSNIVVDVGRVAVKDKDKVQLLKLVKIE